MPRSKYINNSDIAAGSVDADEPPRTWASVSIHQASLS